MPREMKKRGRRARRDEEIVKEKPPSRPPPRLPSPIIDAQQVQTDPSNEKVWPHLDPDTRAYFKQVDERIIELETLGLKEIDRWEEDEPDLDERALLLRSSLESLSGHEVELATDPETSIALERLIHCMDGFGRRVLVDRFAGQYAELCKHRHASHIIQTLIVLGARDVDRECRGVASHKVVGEASKAADLPPMSELLISLSQEISTEIGQLIYDTHGSHIVRASLRLLSATAFEADEEQGRRTTGDQYRSKKSRTYKSLHTPLKPLIPEEDDLDKGKGRALQVPEEFEGALDELVEALYPVLGQEGGASSLKLAATNPVATLVVQLLLTIEADRGGSDRTGSLMDRLLGGLVGSLDLDPNHSEPRSDFLETVLRDATSSHVFEIVLAKASAPVFDWIWSNYFLGRLTKLSSHPVSNFIVAKGIGRLDEVCLLSVVEELGIEDSDRQMIESSRTGVLRAIVEQTIALGAEPSQTVKLLRKGLEITDDGDVRYAVPCCLTLIPFKTFGKHHGDLKSLPEVTVQGALLLQSWLRLAHPHNSPVIESLLQVPVPLLLDICKSPTGSRVIDAFLSSSTVSASHRRRFVTRLNDRLQVLCDDRIGSRVVDRCWDAADVYLMEKMASSLSPHLLFLRGSHFGHFFVRKVDLPLFERRRAEWRNKMTEARVAPVTTVAKAPKVGGPPPSEKPKKRKAERDEIDEVFSKAKVDFKKSKG